MPEFTAVVELAALAATAGGALALIATALARRGRKHRAAREAHGRRPCEVVRREWGASPGAGPGRRTAPGRGFAPQRPSPDHSRRDEASAHFWGLPHYQVDETSWESFEAIARRDAAAAGGSQRGLLSPAHGIRKAAGFDTA